MNVVNRAISCRFKCDPMRPYATLSPLCVCDLSDLCRAMSGYVGLCADYAG
jgi:hypothetical protein